MKMNRFNPEVYFTNEDITKITLEDLEFLKKKSLDNQRKRVRLCAHRDIKDKVHEMIIVHGKDAYVRPHKHSGRSESLHVIDGEACAFIFDDNGRVSEIVHMADKNSGKVFYYRISNDVFHSLIIVTDFFIFHEAVEGPFDKTRTIFAPWSPEEGECKTIDIFTKKLKSHANIKKS